MLNQVTLELRWAPVVLGHWFLVHPAEARAELEKGGHADSN